ncbi:MAG: serine/threonine-protein phosphatase [Actinomycetota bacterium]|nr:serine/threonine-protein phosphatase [Actinomycetota bacterium]
MVVEGRSPGRPAQQHRGSVSRRLRLRMTRSSRRFKASGRPTWGPTLMTLTVVSAALAALTVQFPAGVPVSIFVLVIVLGGFFLPVRALALLFLAIAVALVYVSYGRRDGATPLNQSVVVLLGVTALLMVWIAHSRARLGVQGTAGESMLVDLRDRLRAQGELPVLPPRWHAEVVMRSAYGDQFSGDFLVATRRMDGNSFELALVDVSGKGAGAGTRALLLSGALGGLLGALPPHEFLYAANDYLLRQRWSEGFATAVHVTIDLVSGEFQVDSAGHPPAVHFQSGSGRWAVLGTDGGPLLGVLPDATYRAQTGRLARGDALVLYTDGVVEARSSDLSVGIDRMLGQADLLVTNGFRGGAQRIVDLARAGESDDRACVLVWRS